VAWHGFGQYMDTGKVRLFVGSAGYPDGGQQRDFVHVDDVVNTNLWFFENREVSGIYNCGTGRAQTFNDVAAAVVNGVRESKGEARLPLADLVAGGAIEYIAFPPALAGRYQSYTQADLAQLRAAGYPGEFRPVEQGVDEYVKCLLAARSPMPVA
jgi:ADP-L-glycero-D-manno-heptose 6-epimerase